MEEQSSTGGAEHFYRTPTGMFLSHLEIIWSIFVVIKHEIENHRSNPSNCNPDPRFNKKEKEKETNLDHCVLIDELLHVTYALV